MVRDALRGYVQLASGLTEVTKDKARAAAKSLVEQMSHLGAGPGDAREQVKALADELALTARANRDLVLGMIKSETERAVAALGLASDEDLASLRRRVSALEGRLDTREKTAAVDTDAEPAGAARTPAGFAPSPSDRLPPPAKAPAKAAARAPAKVAARAPAKVAARAPAKVAARAPAKAAAKGPAKAAETAAKTSAKAQPALTRTPRKRAKTSAVPTPADVAARVEGSA